MKGNKTDRTLAMLLIAAIAITFITIFFVNSSHSIITGRATQVGSVMNDRFVIIIVSLVAIITTITVVLGYFLSKKK